MNVSRQIGWSNESNLLYQILKQLNSLTSTIANSSGGGGTPFLTSTEIAFGDASNLLTSSNKLTFNTGLFQIGNDDDNIVAADLSNAAVILGDLANRFTQTRLALRPTENTMALFNNDNNTKFAINKETPTVALDVSGSVILDNAGTGYFHAGDYNELVDGALLSVFNNKASFNNTNNDIKVGINAGSPECALHIEGDFKLKNGSEGAGKVLTSDATGLTSWQDPRPYKVYTALLTQDGSSSPQQTTVGTLSKGVTYQITGASDGDFSNVGAPNNNENTFFVATNNSAPTSYGTCALDYNDGAPIANVLENTIGNIWFTYVAVGVYVINSNGLFTINKSVIFISNNTQDNYDGDQIVKSSQYDLDDLYVNSFATGAVTNFSPSDDVLLNTPIEIRVYN